MGLWIIITILTVVAMAVIYGICDDKNEALAITGGIDLGVGLFFSKMSDYYLCKMTNLDSFYDSKEIGNYEKIYGYVCIVGAILIAIGVIELAIGFVTKLSEGANNQMIIGKSLLKKNTAASGPKFCSHCGNQLENEQTVCPNCGVNVNNKGTKNMTIKSNPCKYCPNCDSKLNANAVRCHNCGTEL